LHLAYWFCSVLRRIYAYVPAARKWLQLKTLLQNLQDHVSPAPSDEQLDHLNEVIRGRSALQRTYLFFRRRRLRPSP